MRFTRLFVTVITVLHFASFVLAQDTTILDHGGSIQSVVFSPIDNSLVASAGGHSTIKLWNLRENTVKNLTDHTGEVNSVAFSPDGKLLVSSSEDSTIKMWDVSEWHSVETAEPITIQMSFSVQTVAFHPDGQLLATSGRHAKLLEVNNRTEMATLQHDQWVWTVAFSRDGRYLATDDGIETTVKVWDVRRKQIATTLEGHTSDVNFVKFSPDNRTLASSSWGGGIRLWDVANWKRRGTFHSSGSAAIDFSADGKILASGGYEEVTLWSVTSGEKIATLQGHTGWIRGVAFSSDGTMLASGGEGGTVRGQDIKPHLESQHQRNIVRLIYFLPSNRVPQPDIDTKLDKLIKNAQRIFAGQMDYYGFGRKTFQFETDEAGNAVVHHVTGKFKDEYYHGQSGVVWEEIDEHFDKSTNIYLVALDTGPEILDGFACGYGGPHGNSGGTVLIPASGHCFEDVDVTVHELGHAFGLHHDFRNDLKPWIDFYSTEPMTTSICATGWLDAHRYFNTHHIYFNEPTTVEMLPLGAVDSNSIRLRFELTDLDGFHQIQLFTTVEYAGAPDLGILACKPLDGINSIAEFVTTQLTPKTDSVTLRIMDKYGNFTQKKFPFNYPSLEDMNMNGTSDIQD